MIDGYGMVLFCEWVSVLYVVSRMVVLVLVLFVLLWLVLDEDIDYCDS